MEKLGNFVNYLKYGNMDFDTSKNFHEILIDISNFDLFSSPMYLNNPELVAKKKQHSKSKDSRTIKEESIDYQTAKMSSKSLSKLVNSSQDSYLLKMNKMNKMNSNSPDSKPLTNKQKLHSKLNETIEENSDLFECKRLQYHL